MIHHGYATAAPVGSMASSSSLRMAEAALNALDPQLQPQCDHQTSQESRVRQELLVDYSHGQPPNLDDSHSRHSLVQFVTNQSTSPTDGHDQLELPPNYVQSESQDTDMSNSQRIFVDYTHGQPSSPSIVNEPAHGDSDVRTQAPPGPDTPTTAATHTPETTFAMWNVFNPPSSPLVVRKVRGAFAPDRRTAVKEVRKKGACLRCRMLKKSCDSGDPCKECAKLETARLWKGECVRTRLTKIFEIYSSGLFMVISHHAIEMAKQTGPVLARPGRLEVNYFPKSGIFLTLPYAETPKHDVPYTETLDPDSDNYITLVNVDDEDLNDKLTLGGRPLYYASNLLTRHRETNSVFKISKFMNATLSLAMDMNQRVLISKALELWVCTCILECEPSDLQIYKNPSQGAMQISSTTADRGGNSHPIASDLVYLQLRRATEKCAEILFKVVMIELEKSLIQRKQADNFETFIGTILLLRCVEQMCHLYKDLDTKTTDSKDEASSNKTYQSPYKSSPRSWPLDKPSHYFWQQGERFSDLLCNMLKLRKVVPKTEIVGGVFVALGEPPNVRQWFEAIQLRVDVLEEAKAKSFDVEDDCSWEFRWIGKAFLKSS
jgi:hypothetical protein